MGINEIFFSFAYLYYVKNAGCRHSCNAVDFSVEPGYNIVLMVIFKRLWYSSPEQDIT